MLPAVVKLCCGISYQHQRNMAGLKRTAVAAIGQEIAQLQQSGQIKFPGWMGYIGSHTSKTYREPKPEDSQPVSIKPEELFYVQQGQDNLRKALKIVEDKDGWKTEITEEIGDVIYSKMMPGARKVFRLETILKASPEELHNILFVKVAEMHMWNPSVQHIKIVKQVGPETIITHEVSAKTTGDLIGQRDFLSIRHCCIHESRIYLGGAATHLESFPVQRGFVRAEDGPTCIIIEPLGEETGSRFTWLLNMDVKGWLPTSIVNQALPRAQVEFTRHLRRRLTAGATLS